MFERILVVCVGNICRSPIAEVMLRRALPAATVSSAGLHAMVGEPMDAMARAVLEAHGFRVGTHVARQIEIAMLHEAELILAMERTQVQMITERAPQVLGRTFLLGKWQDGQEIPDPYGQEQTVFEGVYRVIEAAVNAWLPYLRGAGTGDHTVGPVTTRR